MNHSIFFILKYHLNDFTFCFTRFKRLLDSISQKTLLLRLG
nr:winged helix-turn-helix transcriptional regulator [Helicobacter pylori]